MKCQRKCHVQYENVHLFDNLKKCIDEKKNKKEPFMFKRANLSQLGLVR